MSSWRDGMLKGSFRGVPFFVSSAETSGGRRLNVVEYPERDEPSIEDMGRAAREMSVAMYVIGDDYIDQRFRLLKALDERGPGTLVHPWLGEFQVRVQSWTTSDTQTEGRTAPIQVQFVEEKIIKVTTSPDTRGNVMKKKKSFLDKLLDWFEKAGDLARKPIQYIDKATSTLDKGLDVIQAVKNVSGAVPELTRSLRQVRGRLDAYALNVRAIGQDVMSIVNFGTDFVNELTPIDENNAADHRREMIRLAREMDAELVPGAGAAGAPIQSLIKMSALAGELGAISYVPFDSAEAAILAEQELILKFDAALDAVDPTDEMYAAIQDAIAALHADVSGRIAELPRMVELELKSETDLLTLSMDVYGSIDRLQDIMSQNGIIHPGFVSTASPLKIQASE